MGVSASARSVLLAGWLPGPGLLSSCTRAVIRADRRKLDRWLAGTAVSMVWRASGTARVVYQRWARS